ncbi:hypothetical protein Y032_0057g2780 [Ancylostoma ceylanicum]|uniref:Uncharacterized protein n=1 Tax=Ancylostoma ceylanicum TaxID=53326 RepID=A0A016U5M0_9BILA|nr:hypothetical protein Y032_0057g2780 [Ancylostoma ceylanicum]
MRTSTARDHHSLSGSPLAEESDADPPRVNAYDLKPLISVDVLYNTGVTSRTSTHDYKLEESRHTDPVFLHVTDITLKGVPHLEIKRRKIRRSDNFRATLIPARIDILPATATTRDRTHNKAGASDRCHHCHGMQRHLVVAVVTRTSNPP